jgi:hypothetical protein
LSEDRLLLDIEKGIGDPQTYKSPGIKKELAAASSFLMGFDVSNWIPSEGGEKLKHGHLEPLSLSDPFRVIDAYRSAHIKFPLIYFSRVIHLIL